MIRLRTQTGPNCKRKMKSLSVEVEAEAYSVVSSASKFRLNLSSGELKPNPDDEARFTWRALLENVIVVTQLPANSTILHCLDLIN